MYSSKMDRRYDLEFGVCLQYHGKGAGWGEGRMDVMSRGLHTEMHVCVLFACCMISGGRFTRMHVYEHSVGLTTSAAA